MLFVVCFCVLDDQISLVRNVITSEDVCCVTFILTSIVARSKQNASLPAISALALPQILRIASIYFGDIAESAVLRIMRDFLL